MAVVKRFQNVAARVIRRPDDPPRLVLSGSVRLSNICFAIIDVGLGRWSDHRLAFGKPIRQLPNTVACRKERTIRLRKMSGIDGRERRHLACVRITLWATSLSSENICSLPALKLRTTAHVNTFFKSWRRLSDATSETHKVDYAHNPVGCTRIPTTAAVCPFTNSFKIHNRTVIVLYSITLTYLGSFHSCEKYENWHVSRELHSPKSCSVFHKLLPLMASCR